MEDVDSCHITIICDAELDSFEVHRTHRGSSHKCVYSLMVLVHTAVFGGDLDQPAPLEVGPGPPLDHLPFTAHMRRGSSSGQRRACRVR